MPDSLPIKINRVWKRHGLVRLGLSGVGWALSLLNRRNRRLRRNCRIRDGTGLEIGALSTPVVRQQEGRIYYADFFPAHELVQTYQNVELRDVVEVHFLLNQTTYADIAQAVGPLDYVLASHVFEHVPDPLGWLRALSSLLRPGGIISLAMPDKRHTSEFFRDQTSLDQVLQYYRQALTRPSLEQLLDCNLNLSEVDVLDTWLSPKKIVRKAIAVNTDDIVRRANSGAHVDAHCTAWTSESFLDVMLRAIEMENIPLRLHGYYPPELFRSEFIVQLQKI